MSIDINTLKTAVYSKLNDSNITDLVTGVYHLRAPQGTSFPYILYWIVTGSNMDTFTDFGDSVLVQIDVYCQNTDKNGNPVSGAQHCGVITKAVTQVMDEASLGAGAYFCQRLGPPRDLYEDDTDTFHQVLEYQIMISTAKII